MKISCKFGEPSCCCFPLRALTPKISTRGGGVADAKPKYPPDASGGYNYQCINISTSYTLQFGRYKPDKIFKFKVTTTRSNQDAAHISPPPQWSLPSTNILHLTDPTSCILPPTYLDAIGENTCMALKG